VKNRPRRVSLRAWRSAFDRSGGAKGAAAYVEAYRAALA